ncbi:hypothetical protein PR202_ga20583 [Eleusine coracana subsp. coracana]|uniref:Uncharacterized protein n=1 Tax=Eleusine coracana subsp. coracana TaxID=191504 RepID=A0AAV5CZ53_ELECO|nr:hypothetical protein PR202_ga20583 [Eleusine coracana subsp. coracana]
METAEEGVKMATDDVNGPDVDALDPWNPPYPPCRPIPPDVDFKSYSQLINEWFDEMDEIIAFSRRTKTIVPDRTPESVDDAFYNVLPRLVPILEKDSVRRFLTLYDRVAEGMGWGFIITPLTFTQMVRQNALQCTKAALEGKAPELLGFRANPNCMNRFGYFPLHQAAEIFSVDMVKLLLSYGALANVRTAGPEIIEGLLPLHVAVENTCLHKYLEGNAFPNKGDLNDYQANKIFLDTTRLLAEKTHNIVDELCNYINAGRLVETAVLLLAAEQQIRGVSSCKKNGSTKSDGFSLIKDCILSHKVSLVMEIGRSEKNNKRLKLDIKLTDVALLLVHAVSQAGVALDACIRSHPEVPHNMQVPHDEVLEKVSSILNGHGFFPTGGSINIGNLCSYKHVLSAKELPNELGMLMFVLVNWNL